MLEKYDVCVIGCGPGGFAAAMRGLDFGKNVCIVEGGRIGGAGIVNGAMTSKTLWELAKDYYVASTVDRGYRAANLSVDFHAVRDTVITAAKEKQYQIRSQIESFSPGKWNNGSLSLVNGYGKFLNKKELEVTRKDGSKVIVKADFFIIATGSRPVGFPHIPFDHERIINSDDILSLQRFPKRMMIIGAGIIGCEYATIFSNFGQTEVHLLDRQARIIPFEDEDLSKLISTNLKNNNVHIYHHALIRDILKNESHLEAIVDYEDGHSQVIEVDLVLVSVGRRPNTDNLGLENVGIQTTDRGHITVDENLCATDNIYAIGDITGKSALVNIAEMEGRFAIKAMYGKVQTPINYSNMSTIMFFRPEVAAVGLNEQQCRAKNIPHRVAYYSLSMVNRAIAMRATGGFVKIIVTPDSKPKILGMRSAGPRASDLIISIAIAMDQDKNILEIMRTTQPHPSISEAVQDCFRMLLGKSIYKPRAFPEQMKITSWSPMDGE